MVGTSVANLVREKNGGSGLANKLRFARHDSTTVVARKTSRSGDFEVFSVALAIMRDSIPLRSSVATHSSGVYNGA